MNFAQFPPQQQGYPQQYPQQPQYYQQPQQPMYPQQQNFSYNSPGRQIANDPYPRHQGNLGVSFSGLIGNNVTVPAVPITEQVTEAPKKSKKIKKNKDGAVEVSFTEKNESLAPVSSKEIVETTVYADTYADTNNLTLGIIGQTDELLRDCKQELDQIRAQRALKGRYHYITATVDTMSSLLSTKLQAIKEINNTIKNVNDNEYRRFKDMRALEQTDDNKAVMDAYSAFISAPVGAPEYKLPGTTALTGGLNGIVPAEYPANVQAGMDRGMAQYLANLTPEENLMLNDSNKDIEEVILYDQATGMKKFQWMNTRTGEYLNNMPSSSDLTIQDYSIDPRTMLAKNTNLNTIKKVVTINADKSDFAKF